MNYSYWAMAFRIPRTKNSSNPVPKVFENNHVNPVILSKYLHKDGAIK